MIDETPIAADERKFFRGNKQLFVSEGNQGAVFRPPRSSTYGVLCDSCNSIIPLDFISRFSDNLFRKTAG